MILFILFVIIIPFALALLLAVFGTKGIGRVQPYTDLQIAQYAKGGKSRASRVKRPGGHAQIEYQSRDFLAVCSDSMPGL